MGFFPIGLPTSKNICITFKKYICILNYFQINKDNINLKNLRSFFSKFPHNENSLFSKVFKYKES